MTDTEKLIAEIAAWSDEVLVAQFRNLEKVYDRHGVGPSETRDAIVEAIRAEVARRGLYLD